MKFILFLAPVLLYSQARIAKGMLIDSVTKQPVSYVNISILESVNGASSYEDGSFNLLVEEIDLGKKVKFSSLGYRSKIISVSEILELNVIELQPSIEQLEEVEIFQKFEEITTVINAIDESDLCSGYGTNHKNPWLIALYFPYNEDYEKTEYLKSVRFHFGNYKNKKSKFRLRIFSRGKDSLPDKDLLKESVLVELKKKQKFVDIDISDYNIILPSNGVYIAFEWLYIPFNAEKVTWVKGPYNNKKEKGVMYGPKFAGTCAEDGKFEVAIYNSGKWYFYAANKYKSDKKIIPAFTLTLSN